MTQGSTHATRTRLHRIGPVTPLVLVAGVLVVLSQVGIGRPLLVALVLATVDWRRHRRHRGWRSGSPPAPQRGGASTSDSR